MATTQLAFTPAGDGVFTFDTGVLKGALRQSGKSNGLVQAVHLQTGTELTDGEGLFNHYRVFTRGKRYGYGARRWPSVATCADDGSVGVFWKATSERPFELRGRYVWVSPDTIDVVTSVRAVDRLEAFEVFLGSYYNSQFIDSQVWVENAPLNGDNAGFATATKDQGIWQAFPRDSDSKRVISDGRWMLEPHPLDWNLKQPYALPLAIRRDPVSGITVVSVAQPDKCFGVFTPFGEEKHYSNYFSLFGHDIQPDETVTTRSRLIVMSNPTDEGILARANDFLNHPD